MVWGESVSKRQLLTTLFIGNGWRKYIFLSLHVALVWIVKWICVNNGGNAGSRARGMLLIINNGLIFWKRNTGCGVYSLSYHFWLFDHQLALLYFISLRASAVGFENFRIIAQMWICSALAYPALQFVCYPYISLHPWAVVLINLFVGQCLSFFCILSSLCKVLLKPI